MEIPTAASEVQSARRLKHLLMAVEEQPERFPAITSEHLMRFHTIIDDMRRRAEAGPPGRSCCATSEHGVGGALKQVSRAEEPSSDEPD